MVKKATNCIAIIRLIKWITNFIKRFMEVYTI